MPEFYDDLRRFHLHVTGRPGSGKTTLLAWQAFNDIVRKIGGVCAIDPKGGKKALAEIVSRYIPEDRLDDCIWLDIADPIPLDVMSCPPGKESTVAAELTYILTQGELDSAHAPDLTTNIDNLINTLIDANKHIPEEHQEKRCTFMDIYRFFEEPERQREILKYVRDPRFKAPLTPDKYPNPTARSRIRTRVNNWVNNLSLCAILGEPKPRLNLDEVIRTKKILLATVPVDNPASIDYGSLLVSKIQHAAFSNERADIAENKRTPFFLYIDEFQHFKASDKFEVMLDMARSFRLCLTLSNTRLSRIDKGVLSGLKLVGSVILFHISDEDVGHFASMIGTEDPSADVRNRAERLYHDAAAFNDPVMWGKYSALKKHADSLPRRVTVYDALSLPDFKAIYKFGNEPPVIDDIPTGPDEEPTEEQAAKLKYIKAKTRERYGPTSHNYAEILLKRIGDNASCNSTEVNHHEINAPISKEVGENPPQRPAVRQVDRGQKKRPKPSR